MLVALLLTCSGGAAGAAGAAGEAVRVLGAGVAGSPSYVMAGQPAVLECRFQLEPQELLQGVTWTKDAQLVYRWLPAGRTLENATAGVAAEQRRPGWDVHIARAATAMAGNYSCSVHTDRGSAASRRFHLAVLLVCKARIETEDSTGVNCTVGWRLTCARVFPDLNLTAGVFDADAGKFIDRVTEWTKVVYSDDTFGYHAFKSYHVAEIPKSSVFLWSLSYQDQTPLVTGNVSSGAVHRAWSGCSEPPPPQDASLHVQLLYDGGVGAGTGAGTGADCRGRPRAPVKAVYTCANEILYQDQDHHVDSPASKELVCVNGEWREGDTATPWPVC
ncbi:hypothetical protein ONE63_004142 [Megalurothrips usitatus]|uniref:Immunoglobulin domain-containing protein n=1 Tax=Megalurothrips usitatus TaxID=439358 RepID=A0AAV7X594_9NEOP|nr:hypothetical protein ONE63_004142 [Megalurothrips usitatus]